jgi:multisubunit Na+/H+ antiporter MnhE subunit
LAQAAILLFLGLGALWTLWVQRALTLQDWFFAGVAVLLCAALALRFARRTPSQKLAFKAFAVFASRVGQSWRDAGAVMSAALSADIKLRPSLVRVRLRGADESAHAAFANLVTAAPGAVSVELDTDGLLVHVLREDSIDARVLGRLEARLSSGAPETRA